MLFFLKICTVGVVILHRPESNIRIWKCFIQCAFCCRYWLPHLGEAHENMTERRMFLPGIVAHLCPFQFATHLQSFSSYSSRQPLQSCPLHTGALIIPTFFTFVSSVSIHSSASLSAFSVLSHLAHPSTPPPTPIRWRQLEAPEVSTVVRSKWPTGSPGWHLKCTHMEHSHG